MRNKILLLIVGFSFFLINSYGQEYNIGIRAGSNFSTLLGPEEINENTGFNTGFHFGLSFQYNLGENIGIRSELLYVQNGKSTEYEGDSYYILRTLDDGGNVKIIYDDGYAKYKLKVSTATISLPITFHYKPTRRFEFFGGGYVNFIIGPRATGSLDYESYRNDPGVYEVFFIQSLDYDYFKDVVGGAGFNNTIALIIDEKVNGLPRIAGSYYQYDEKIGNKYRKIDAGITAGTNFYFNPGFYMGLRAEYGFRDQTNELMDVSLRSLSSENTLIRLDDRDTHFGIQVSLGFKF